MASLQPPTNGIPGIVTGLCGTLAISTDIWCVSVRYIPYKYVNKSNVYECVCVCVCVCCLYIWTAGNKHYTHHCVCVCVCVCVPNVRVIANSMNCLHFFALVAVTFPSSSLSLSLFLPLQLQLFMFCSFCCLLGCFFSVFYLVVFCMISFIIRVQN